MNRHESARRTYRGAGAFLRDLRLLVRHPAALLALCRGTPLSHAFRERLMLAVTGVNRCRHCAAFHTRLALQAGIPREAVRDLLGGSVDRCPDAEVPALLFARTWAECDGRPPLQSRQELRRVYGDARAQVIETALRAIRVGNLAGNTLDSLLCRASRGRFGCDPPPRPAPERLATGTRTRQAAPIPRAPNAGRGA